MNRLTPIILAAAAILAVAALPAAADKPVGPGKSKAAPHGPAKGIGHGVTKIKGGSTTLEADAATLATLTGAGLALAPVTPATAIGATFAFPITKGRVHYAKGKKKLSGHVDHSGGLSFAKGAVSVTASDLRVQLSSRKKVRVFANFGAEKVRLLDLKDVTVVNGMISASAVLSQAAAAKLNTGLAVTTFVAGMPLGKIVVSPAS